MIASRITSCGGRRFAFACRGVLIGIVFPIELDRLDD
jgi:hypothetical protein